jgi:hypothetical protein
MSMCIEHDDVDLGAGRFLTYSVQAYEDGSALFSWDSRSGTSIGLGGGGGGMPAFTGLRAGAEVSAVICDSRLR